jgi:hypothetical protein
LFASLYCNNEMCKHNRYIGSKFICCKPDAVQMVQVNAVKTDDRSPIDNVLKCTSFERGDVL